MPLKRNITSFGVKSDQSKKLAQSKITFSAILPSKLRKEEPLKSFTVFVWSGAEALAIVSAFVVAVDFEASGLTSSSITSLLIPDFRNLPVHTYLGFQ